MQVSLASHCLNPDAMYGCEAARSSHIPRLHPMCITVHHRVAAAAAAAAAALLVYRYAWRHSRRVLLRGY